jgi:hypothetical protein
MLLGSIRLFELLLEDEDLPDEDRQKIEGPATGRRFPDQVHRMSRPTLEWNITDEAHRCYGKMSFKHI